MSQDELLVSVRRNLRDHQTATYRLEDVGDTHWSDTTGGLARRMTARSLCAYVCCDSMIEGSVAHSCRHGEGPHRIKVCIPKKYNRNVYATLQRQADEREAAR